jgi:beta-lactamase class D
MPRQLDLSFVILLMLSAGCAGGGAPHASEIDLSRHFGGVDGCFVLLDVSGDQLLRYNPQRCGTRFAPCSTFKIPNSLIGLETGVIPDADHVIKWDGIQRDRPELNRDHTLRSAMANSVVWYYQELARRVGEARMQQFLDAIPYGNRDMSAGLTTFWLGTSLKISPDEQVEFLRRLQRDDLPFSRRSMQIVKEILVQDSRPGLIYRGKTGSNRGTEGAPDLGWYVGWVERDGDVFVFATNISGRGTFGARARAITESILHERGIL